MSVQKIKKILFPVFLALFLSPMAADTANAYGNSGGSVNSNVDRVFSGVDGPSTIASEQAAQVNDILSWQDSNTGTDVGNHTIASEVNIAGFNAGMLQDWLHQMHDVNLLSASKKILTPGAAQAAAQLMKVNQAALEVAAAADDLGNGLTYAIAEHYSGMTREQIIADIVEEGRSYGVIEDAPFKSAKNGKTPFGFVADAYAVGDPGISGAIPVGMGDGSRGNASDCSCAKTTKFGPGCPGKVQDPSKKLCQMHIYAGKIDFISVAVGDAVETTPGHNGNGSENATSQANKEIFSQLGFSVHGGKRLTPHMHELAFNTNACGNTVAADNSGPSGFFISKAYAQAGGDSTASLVQNLCTKEKNLAEAAHKADEGEPYQAITARQAQVLDAMATATSGNNAVFKMELRDAKDLGRDMQQAAMQQMSLFAAP